MDILARDLHIDGFLCPGHVAVITGSRPFFHLAETSGKPMVIGGFTPPLLLRALSRLVLEASGKKGGLWNEYPSVVREEGNPKALSLMHEIFEAGDAVWRGLGTIRGSGLYISGNMNSWTPAAGALQKTSCPKAAAAPLCSPAAWCLKTAPASESLYPGPSGRGLHGIRRRGLLHYLSGRLI